MAPCAFFATTYHCFLPWGDIHQFPDQNQRHRQLVVGKQDDALGPH